MIFHPYSESIQFASGGRWDCSSKSAITTNFPAVKHWFPISETSGSTIADRAGGLTCTLTAPTWGTANAVVPAPGGAANNAISGGTLTAPGASPFILMMVGKFTTTANLVWGTSGTAGGISLTQAATAALYDGTNTLAGTAFTSGGSTIYGRGNACDWTNQQNFEATTTTTSTALTAVACSTATPGTIAGGIAAVDQSIRFDANCTALYGILFIKFAGSLPSATFLKSMVAWHTYQWANGNKWLYPGLKDIS